MAFNRVKIPKKSLIIFSLLVIYFIYRFFFIFTMYDDYENRKTIFEDENVLVESLFFPAYDYSSPNIIFVHYRDIYYFELKIKDKTGNLTKAEILNNKIIKDGLSNDFISHESMSKAGLDRVFMSPSFWNYKIKEDYIEKFLTGKTLIFGKIDSFNIDEYSVSFRIPVDYKKDSKVTMDLEIRFVFDGGEQDKIVKLEFGGKRKRHVEF